MAQRPPYSINSDDPDILRFKEMYPDIFEKILDCQFDSLPGKEVDTWNSLSALTGETFSKYIDHCIEHYEFLIGRWSPVNQDKIVNFLITLSESNFCGNDAIRTAFIHIDELCNEFRYLANTERVFGSSFAQREPISMWQFNLLITESINTFVAISNECEASDLFNKLIDTESQAFVKKHHFLAGQAAFLASLAHKHEINAAGAGGCFLPLIFKMLQQAILWQQEDKAERGNEKVSKHKRRRLYSPDSFLFKQASDGASSQLFRSVTRDFFIKVWLFKFLESNTSKTGKQLSKQALLNEMSKRIKECANMPPKTLENLLSNLSKLGYVSSQLSKLLN